MILNERLELLVRDYNDSGDDGRSRIMCQAATNRAAMIVLEEVQNLFDEYESRGDGFSGMQDDLQRWYEALPITD